MKKICFIFRLCYIPLYQSVIQISYSVTMKKALFIFRLFCIHIIVAIFSNAYAGYKLEKQYQCIEKNDQKIHVLEISPQYFKIIVANTSDDKGALETVSSLASKTGALAAINGGFFYIDDQKRAHPAGPLKIKNEWLGRTTKPHAAIGWSENNKRVLIDRIVLQSMPENDTSSIKVKPHFDKHKNALKAWQEADYILGGIPLLFKKNELITDFSREVTSKSFIEKKHARTAVCIKPNHNWLFVVAEHTKEKDARYVKKVNHGLTILELSRLMQSLGCEEAINLDGGGSSVMVLNQRIMNDTVGDMDELIHAYHERPVLNAVLVLPNQ